jgi:rhodanese-related sulfurtransferase
MADRLVTDMNDVSRCGRTADHPEHLIELIRSANGQVLVVDTTSEQFAVAQHDDRWHTIVLPVDAGTAHDGTLRAVLHAAMQHLQPGGRVAAHLPVGRVPAYLELCRGVDLDLESRTVGPDRTLVVHRRSMRFNVHDLVFEARSSIRRLDPTELAERLVAPDPPLVLDTRTHTDRLRFGVIAHSVHTPRTVLKWHLDPANGYRLPELRDLDHPLVVVCNGGYSSSLAAANLVRLGFTDVGDLRGGVHAWRRAGLSLVEPDRSHLDPSPADS